MTFLSRQLEGDVSWAKDAEKSFQGWVSPGSYLRESTLLPLAQYYCGGEILDGLLKVCSNITFADYQVPSPESESGMRSEKALLDLKKLCLPSSRPAGIENDVEDSGTDGEVSEGGGNGV